MIIASLATVSPLKSCDIRVLPIAKVAEDVCNSAKSSVYWITTAPIRKLVIVLESEVQAINAPALIVFGDNDAVRPEYEVHLFRLLGGGKAMRGSTKPLAS